MLLNRRYSLTTKFNVLVTGLILLATLGTTVTMLLHEMTEHYERLLKSSSALATMVSQTSEYGVYTENENALSQIARSLQAYPYLTYVRFSDVRGRVLDDYLSKPIRAAELMRVLARFLPHVPGSARVTPPAGDIRPNAALDPKVLETIRHLQRPGAPDLVEKVIGLYLRDAPPLMASLCAALHQGQCSDVQRAAHTLKTMSANVGALRLAEAFKELEADSRLGDLHHTAQELLGIQREYEEAQIALRKINSEVMS